MNSLFKNCWMLLGATFFLTACQNNYFDQQLELKDGLWSHADSLGFDIQIDDTTAIYNLFLEVKHHKDYGYQNAYSMVQVAFPDGNKREQQVSFELADAQGLWMGKCSGNFCKQRLSFMPNAVFQQIGSHQISFKQYTRTDSLSGIHALRLIVEKTKLKKGDLQQE